MSDPEIQPEQHSAPSQTDPITTKPETISFSIWPPTQRTRDAVINRLIETLSNTSILSKRYGTLSSDEASAAARQIEDEAFSAAGVSSSSSADGIEILQVYSKEISKRMLDTFKARAPPASDVAPPSAAAVSDS
ncbi:MFP1 attachment factor 1-like [Abrus precatorius]|uniref:MFP1 attachment factor 1-like n=1 Tax=Abrus precatorius TaxID=3816 RepID=A0A8B8JPC4_ABRPR|nr:MFP1 attachment factor 1-like [Abrus precatorius]